MSKAKLLTSTATLPMPYAPFPQRKVWTRHSYEKYSIEFVERDVVRVTGSAGDHTFTEEMLLPA